MIYVAIGAIAATFGFVAGVLLSGRVIDWLNGDDPVLKQYDD